MVLFHSTWLLIIPFHDYLPLLNYTLHTLPWQYFSQLECILDYHGSTSLYLTLHYLTMAALHSTGLYIPLPGLYFTLLDSTLLDNGFTSLYFTLPYSTVGSTWLYITLPWLSFIPLECTLLYPVSTSLYLILHYSTMVLLHSTWV